MIAHAKLRLGSGFQADRAILYYAQRLVIHPWLRRSISRAIAALIRRKQGTDVWEPIGRYTSVASQLHEQGIAMLPGFVSEDKANSIMNYLRDRDVLLSDGRRMPFAALPPAARTADYPLQILIENPDILSVVNAAPVMRIATDYLGCKPTLSSLGAHWAFPGTEPAVASQYFHRDLDDWRFLKLFVYLTDVDHGSGPHIYVMQSHRTAGSFRARPYSQSMIDSHYGRDKAHTVLGPRGTAFVADSYGIHAGMVPTRAPRLVLQAQYSLLPIFAFRYE